MKMMDCIEVIVEKNKYAKEGVHKGMQGVIWEPDSKDGEWVVLIPQCGEKEDIADLYIHEEDMKVIPKMDAKINEQIKAQYDTVDTDTKGFAEGTDSLSDYMI